MVACKRVRRMKLISMGNAEVGKSCIIKRYCERRFIHKYLMTIGIDFGVTRVPVGETELKVNIFDMAGHDVFEEVRREFYKDAQGAILVYDVSDHNSFSALEKWLDELSQEMPKEDLDRLVIIVCANKIDKRHRAVDDTEARMWADKNGLRYFEVSALSGEGVSEMFETLFSDMVTTIESGKKPKVATKGNYTKEQIDAIKKLRNCANHYERLSLSPNATKDDINRAYRKLAVLLHPDKCSAPGCEEAFKVLAATRTQLLNSK